MILLHMETLGNVRSFLSAAREVSLNKPVIVLKTGRSRSPAQVMAWQPNGEADDEVVEAAFRRVGVLRVDTIDDLFFTADALSKQPRPKGPRLMVISNAGGPEVLAADSVVAMGGELAELPPQARRELDGALPAQSGQRDSGDIRDGGSPEAYVKAVDIAARDSNCDGLLLVTVPLAFSDPRRATELLLNMHKNAGKPVLACLLGGTTAAREEVVIKACIPTLPSPHTAARVFNFMWRYSYNLRGIYETPMFRSNGTEQALRELATSMVHAARDSGRNILTEIEAMSLLAAYGISSVTTRLASSEEEAVRIASEIGFPVELRVVCDKGTPAAGVEGMPLDLFDADTVRSAWKMIMRQLAEKGKGGERFALALQPKQAAECYDLRIASKLDPQLGPVLLFGAGGKLPNLFRDRAVGLPPLNATLARRVMERTEIYKALRQLPVDLANLEAVLVHCGELVVEQPWIREMEIHLSASGKSLLARSVRVEVHGPQVRREQLPRPAIRPYPTQHVSSWVTKDGQAVTIRPIRAEDEPLMIKFHEGLSDRSVYLRYFQGMALDQRTTHDRLTRICFIDYDREIALVAERRDPHTEERRIIALGNLTKTHRGNDGEIAAITSDECQGRGLGSEMLRRLLQIARDENLERIIGTTLPENRQMCAMLKRLGFRLTVNLDDNLVEGELPLHSRPSS
jgi:acetyltransferase